MEGDYIKIREGLLPFSWLYGGVVKMRNFCFDVGLLKSRAFHVPVIAVGNITVGGTGKTPHVEYLVRLLREKFSVAVLSRGYKRKTSGYLLADADTTAREIGDEPFQMKTKFPDISVAVDGKRVRGIQRLTDNDEKLDVILLDDAFQHRYVKPGVNILLVDYHRLIIYDKLLPAGRLREPLSGKNRADIVIVTKCPKELKPMEFRVITKAMSLYPYQHLYFTTLDYGELQPVFNENHNENEKGNEDQNQNEKESAVCSLPADSNVLLLTGIASPRQMEEDLRPKVKSLSLLTFPDHHHFNRKDVRRINETFGQMPSPKLIITTEKDAARLTAIDGLSDEVRRNLFALPVRITFMQKEQEQKFCDFIVGYVLKNSRNSILVKGKDSHPKPANSKQHPASHDSNTISFK
ncbi:MAG: tetraacyldisaccharide 4'-kinase [Prevotella sp.]|nr:tetraacyldisaccharide 4'-kinase [Prevotella sp.]